MASKIWSLLGIHNLRRVVSSHIGIALVLNSCSLLILNKRPQIVHLLLLKIGAQDVLLLLLLSFPLLRLFELCSICLTYSCLILVFANLDSCNIVCWNLIIGSEDYVGILLHDVALATLSGAFGWLLLFNAIAYVHVDLLCCGHTLHLHVRLLFTDLHVVALFASIVNGCSTFIRRIWCRRKSKLLVKFLPKNL